MTLPLPSRVAGPDLANLPSPKIRAMQEIGTSGLARSGGWVTEEWLRDLQDWERAYRAYREMRDNSPVVGSVLFALEMLARETPYRIEPGDDESSADAEAAEFVDTSLEDMSQSWDDTLGDALSCLAYGWAYHELIYKRRQGENRQPGLASRYNDGKIGWRKWAIRSQSTLWKWELDPQGGIKGMWQFDPSDDAGRGVVLIPIEKALLFRPFSYLNNPQGRSLLRNAYVPYYYVKRIQEIEAVGVERNLNGLPVLSIPAEVMNDANKFAAWKKVVTDLRRNEQAGLVLPSDLWPETQEPMFKLELLSTDGERAVPTNEIIERYETRLAQVVLADFIHLGNRSVGTQALAGTKTNVFATAMNALLDSIAGTINRHAIPRLMALNGFAVEQPPRLVFDDVEYDDIQAWAEALSKLAAAGMPIFPDPLLENVVRGKLDLPELTEEAIEEREAEDAKREAMERDMEREALNQARADVQATNQGARGRAEAE